MQIKKILWATDGSKESEEALGWAEILALPFGATVIGLNVLESPNLDTLEMPADLRKEISLVESEMGKKEARRLTRIKNILAKKGIRAEMRILRGVPHEEIVKSARGRGVDLIAMGKTALTPWGRMLVGSTTASVIREVHIPVLTARRVRRKRTLKKILLPMSFSDTESVAVEWALELGRKLDAAVFLLHVIAVHKSYESVRGGFMGRLRDSAAKQLHVILDSVPTHKRKDVKLVEKVTAFPRAWSGIVSFANDEGMDMIVMSTRARRNMSRFVLGSVAESVVKEAPCPVVTIAP
jgi:nucleotide-binding universal stress UspA family protein